MKAKQVAANDGFGLYDGFSAEDDVLGPVDEGAAGDFVAGVLCLVLARAVWWCYCLGSCGVLIGRRTVSMYSPFAALGGMVTVGYNTSNLPK